MPDPIFAKDLLRLNVGDLEKCRYGPTICLSAMYYAAFN